MKLSKYIFPFFALFVLFADELFYSFVSLTGGTLVSGMKSREAIVIAAVAFLMLFSDIIKGKLSARNWKQLLALFVILVLYVVTGFLYPHDAIYERYFAYLLVYGAISIPAAYVGMRLARERCKDELFKILPWVIIPVVFVVFLAIRSSANSGYLLGWGDEEDVFNYQNASYYMSFCYAYCFFYVFLMGNDKYVRQVGKGGKAIMLLLMFVCAIGCIVGGGRGAFVYIVFITAYLVWRILHQKGRNNVGTVILLIVAAVVMAFLAMKLDIFESVGFTRVSGSLTEDEYRMEFMRKALAAFGDSPIIGHGVGSIWWEVGFYSHNIVTDLLVETGIIGTLIAVYVLMKITVSLMKSSKYDSLDMFMLVVFLGALVHDTFSGYWIASSKFFMMFGYVYAKGKQ